ncbi:hypothetical protein GCM10010207_69100 [Streptomyces atratus]|nr:hypothetical protein GCM10010207_69100 [Streptomyces atratus]
MTTAKDILAACPAELGNIDKLARCIEACNICAQACTACADACPKAWSAT